MQTNSSPNLTEQIILDAYKAGELQKASLERVKKNPEYMLGTFVQGEFAEWVDIDRVIERYLARANQAPNTSETTDFTVSEEVHDNPEKLQEFLEQIGRREDDDKEITGYIPPGQILKYTANGVQRQLTIQLSSTATTQTNVLHQLLDLTRKA
jgi:hypothetical protein